MSEPETRPLVAAPNAAARMQELLKQEAVVTPTPTPDVDTQRVPGGIRPDEEEPESTLARTHATTQESEPTREHESVRASTQPDTRESKHATKRESVVESMLASALVTLNTRVPSEISDWFDRRAFEGRKQGVSKQGLVIEALAEYIARHTAEGGE
jgi:hypothetical protein